jgi:hypothetical protein
MIILLLLIDVTKLVLVLLLLLPHFIVVCLFWFCLMGKSLLTHVFIVKIVF